jgi:type II secretory pathway pseudopilin PulG
MTVPVSTLPFGQPVGPGTTPAGAAVPEVVVPLTAGHPMARVDLMPPEVQRARRSRRARRFMVLAVAGVALVAAAASVASWQAAVAAREELAAEQDRTRQLQADAARYAEVPAVLGSIDRARTSLGLAMAQEIGWYPVLEDIVRTAPENVWFEQVTLAAVPAGAVVDDPLATPGAVATVEMTGRALDHRDVVDWLEGMDGLATWTDPVFTESAAEVGGASEAAEAGGAGGPLTFTTSARLSAENYTQRFDPARAAAPTAGGDDR